MTNDFSNPEAERSVIGSLIYDRRVQDQASRLTDEDFTVREYRHAFREIQRLRAEKKPVDLVTVGMCISDPDVMSAIVEAGRMTPVTFNCNQYVDMVLDATMRRKASDIGAALYKIMGDRQSDAQTAIAEARAKLADIGLSDAADWLAAGDIASRTLADLESRVKGDIKPIQSGIRDLDYITGGFFPGELTIVGAKPGVGKSVFGMMVAIHAARTGFRSGVCSLEMVDTQYGQRLISNLSGVDGMKIRKADITDTDWPPIIDAVVELSKIPTAFMFTARFIEDLTLAVKQRKDRDGLDILIVDYLQLLRTRQKTESERLSIAAISWALKCLAAECRIPVIALAQLRRPESGQANKMPTMRDLRESGNLEADADNIILLHEPDSASDPSVYKDDREYFDQMRKNGDRYIAMKVEKQRQGSTGILSVLFKPSRMKYTQIDRRA